MTLHACTGTESPLIINFDYGLKEEEINNDKPKENEMSINEENNVNKEK